MRTMTRRAWLLAASLGAVGGCADRRLQITSDPSGARVFLNDTEVGTTPCEVNFTYFGTYDVRLRRDGCEPLVTKAKTVAPVYEWPGIDLAAAAVPGVKRTSVRWHFDLQPAVRDDAALLARAAELRDRQRARDDDDAEKPR